MPLHGIIEMKHHLVACWNASRTSSCSSGENVLMTPSVLITPPWVALARDAMSDGESGELEERRATSVDLTLAFRIVVHWARQNVPPKARNFLVVYGKLVRYIWSGRMLIKVRTKRLITVKIFKPSMGSSKRACATEGPSVSPLPMPITNKDLCVQPAITHRSQ
jgi:hypothetical protein